MAPESIKVEKMKDKEEKPKKRRRRKKVETESESTETMATDDAHPPAPNSHVPNIPVMMPNIPTDVQQMYLMQMQHLQDMHMALFANAMANQNFANGHGSKHNNPATTHTATMPPPAYGFGNQMEMFSQASHPQTFSSASQGRFQNPQSEVSGPMDLSLEKQG